MTTKAPKTRTHRYTSSSKAVLQEQENEVWTMFAKTYTRVPVLLGTVYGGRCKTCHVICCSAWSTWRQPLFRFYLDACWKFSEQSFSLKSACRLKHIISPLSCENIIILAFMVVQKSAPECGYFCTRIENEKRRFRQAARCKRSDSVWWLTGESDNQESCMVFAR